MNCAAGVSRLCAARRPVDCPAAKSYLRCQSGRDAIRRQKQVAFLRAQPGVELKSKAVVTVDCLLDLFDRGKRLARQGPYPPTEGVALEWLTPILLRFREEHAQIDFQIIVRNTAVNVLRREADIAIRLGRPQQKELVARRVASLALGLYASRDYLEQRGEPRTPADLDGHDAVAFDEGDRFTGAGQWLERSVAPARVAYRANTLGAQRAAIRAGFGIGGQACFIADREPELVRVLPEIETPLEIWLVTHPGLRHSARIRAVYDFLAEQLVGARPLLGGEAAG